MDFSNLNQWGDYWYLCRMDSLCVFDAAGTRVAEWYSTYIDRPYGWIFQCLVNTLPPTLAQDFGIIVKEWEDYVTKRLEECHAD